MQESQTQEGSIMIIPNLYINCNLTKENQNRSENGFSVKYKSNKAYEMDLDSFAVCNSAIDALNFYETNVDQKLDLDEFSDKLDLNFDIICARVHEMKYAIAMKKKEKESNNNEKNMSALVSALRNQIANLKQENTDLQQKYYHLSGQSEGGGERIPGQAYANKNKNNNNRRLSIDIRERERVTVIVNGYVHNHGKGRSIQIPSKINAHIIAFYFISSANRIDFHLKHMNQPALMQDLAQFLKTLPPKSKQHIWDHSVKFKLPDGRKVIDDSTGVKDQIVKLISDCVIVYVKYLDRFRAPLSASKVKPNVEEAAVYIYKKYNPLRRKNFENDNTYFTDMLEDFVQSKCDN